jgi:hypothetical protein
LLFVDTSKIFASAFSMYIKDKQISLWVSVWVGRKFWARTTAFGKQVEEAALEQFIYKVWAQLQNFGPSFRPEILEFPACCFIHECFKVLKRNNSLVLLWYDRGKFFKLAFWVKIWPPILNMPPGGSSWGPFLTSPPGENFDPQGRSCPPRGEFVP